MRAQQEGVLMMYEEHMGLINPAFVGSTGAYIIGSIRSQWVGIEGAPELQAVSLALPLGKKIGLGLSVISDQVFVEDRTSTNVDFSYLVRLSEKTKLYLGLKGGGGTYSLNPYLLENSRTLLDPDLNLGSQFNPNIGVGGYLVAGRFYLSISSPRILGTTRFNEGRVSTTQVTERLHVFAGAGYEFLMSKSLGLKISAMHRNVKNAPSTTDFLASLRMLPTGFEIGGAYNTNNVLGGFFSVPFKSRMYLGYAYSNIIASQFVGNTKGTHEFFMRFKLN